MEIKVLASKQESLVIQRNILFGLSLVTLIGNLLLGICLLKQERQIVLVPADLSKQVNISNKRLSKAYLEEMSVFFISKLLDLTSLSIDYQTEVILRHIHPRNYSKIYAFLSEEKKRYKEFNLSTHFIINELKLDEDALRAEAIGTYVSQYGTSGKSDEKMRYLIEYDYSGGVLTIKNFGIIKEQAEE